MLGGVVVDLVVHIEVDHLAFDLEAPVAVGEAAVQEGTWNLNLGFSELDPQRPSPPGSGLPEILHHP